ncbi:hypothetical protein [uncultured Flavobacterium sp.]|uniref:hypothetical protein n=1 Tax=uncultured Flavobacterium sp. TaxID=165435 RepID=UPI0029303488|nr:hypothetical protein [uncultured Flavobacterium sp.]
MKQLKNIIILIPFFILSCASGQYLKSYEPINVFLETQKIDKNKKYILQAEKIDNKKVIADFNEFKSAGSYFDSNFQPIAYHNEKEYKKMYNKYINDTLKRYWKKDDFLDFKFIIRKKQDITSDSINNYLPDQYWISISEPMYYWKQRYLIFSYNIYNHNGGTTNLIFMKKEGGKWKIDKISSTDVFF